MDTDAELLGRILKRDREAFAALYDRWAPVLFSFSVRVLRDAGDAEEVVQDVFVQVWKDAHRFDAARGSIKTWLFTITRSRALDRWRSRRTAEQRLASAEELPELEAPDGDPAAQSQLSRLVARQMGRLSAKERTVLTLAYFEGLTQEEIAERIGEPLGTVKGRARSGLAKLHSLFLGEKADG
jgi:RNA polymerase sigma-70 factor (ECF subfamily)